MRYLVLLVMIVLLPLRGWAGDSMATQMAMPKAMTVSVSQIAIESGVAKANKNWAKNTFEHQKQNKPDCHENTAGPSAVEVTASHGAGSNHGENFQGNCQACQACQACHTAALLPALLEISANSSSPQMHATHTAFTSAAAALGQKPPIA